MTCSGGFRAKFGQGLLSGDYSKPPTDTQNVVSCSSHLHIYLAPLFLMLVGGRVGKKDLGEISTKSKLCQI